MNARVQAVLDRTPSDGTVLDVGAVQHDADNASNDDWLHKHLRDECEDVVGIDVVESEVDALQDEGYDVREADAEAMDLDGRFDAIVAGELIEHLSNPGAFLDRARDHLTDGGQLILTTPNVWGACYLKRTLLPGEVHCNDEHTGWYDVRTLRQLLERHDYEVAEREFVAPPFRGEYLSWACWQVGLRRFGALNFLVVAEPA